MGNSSSHQITPETANQVVFGQKPEMSPLETLELINNLEKQINNIVQSSNIALVPVEGGIALAELDEQLRQSKIIQRLDKDITEKLVQLQLLHIRKHVHRDIFTTYTSDHHVPREFPAFSETYLVDRDVLKVPSVAAYKLRLQQREEQRQSKMKQEQQRLDQLQQQKQKPVIKTTTTTTSSNNNSSSITGRVEGTRQSRFDGPYQYMPQDASPLNNKNNQQSQQPPQSQQQVLPPPTARQTLPPPVASAQSYANLYNDLVPPMSDCLSYTDGTHSNRSSTIFSSVDESTNLSTFSSNSNTNNTSLSSLLPPPPIKHDKHDASGWLPAPDSPEFAESQKKHFKSLMSYLEPPSSGNGPMPPFSPYTESVYSDFSAPDSIVDMSKFPDYHSHYTSHYTPSGFQVVLNQDDDTASEHVNDFDEAETSDVETIKGPRAPESPSLTEVLAQHPDDIPLFTPDTTKIEQRMSMIMQEVKPLVIRERASMIEQHQEEPLVAVPSPESLPMPSPQSPLLMSDDMFVPAESPSPRLTYDDLLNRTISVSPVSMVEKPVKHVVIRPPSPVPSPVHTLTPADSPIPDLAALAADEIERDDDVVIITPESAATPLPLSIPEQVKATDRAMVLPFFEPNSPISVVAAETSISNNESETKVVVTSPLPSDTLVPAVAATAVAAAAAVAPKKTNAAPPKKSRWPFGLFSSSNKKKSKAAAASKSTKAKSVPKRAPSVQSRASSTKRAGSIRHAATPVQRAGSVRRQGSVRRAGTVQRKPSVRRTAAGSSTAILAGAAMQRTGSLRRNVSFKRTGSIISSTSSRHRKTASSPASAFDFKQQRQPSISRRPSTVQGSQRYRQTRSAVGGSAASRPYRGSVYPIQPQPQAAPAHEYRMYTSRSGTLRRKVSDVSIASKLRNVNGDKTLLGQGIPPKVPLHSAKSLSRRGTHVGMAAAAAAISADHLVVADTTIAQDGSHHDADKAMYDTQIYTRKCTFKRANKSASDDSAANAVEEKNKEADNDDVQILATVASPVLPKSAGEFMLAGYNESSTRLKVVNRHNESALNTPQLGTPAKRTSSDVPAELAHEFHSQNKLALSPNPAVSLERAGAHHEKNKLSVQSIATTTNTQKIQSQTNESLARAKKYFSWGPQQQALKIKKQRYVVPATNPLPDAKICASPRLTADAASKRHTVLGTPGIGKGYYFGLDILGTMEQQQPDPAASSVGCTSPTIRVVGSKNGTGDTDDDDDDANEGLFESLQNRRSLQLADAIEQSNRLWANRGALFYGSK
ncbi:hypothetical protein D0Z00_001504 [Geotrichum galactomycetum]|uniref:Uncharacterized protein n=1 Tax=Geotrichum galactomycetum TaxID=27317 RepID=A0ACB6V6N4_9ASCO|nr:hypothetical protein D0Z00_001504 [Geotrichum candidum]